MRRNRFYRSGFTLIELLVAISIIAVLASIMLPSIATARRKMTHLQCGNNLRQLGLALIAYGDSYDGFLPIRSSSANLMNDFPHLVDRNSAWTSSTPVASRLAATLVDLVGGQSKIFYCPANFEKRTEKTWWPRGDDFGSTYQFPFLLPAARWSIPAPDYGPNRASTALLAADYFATYDFGHTNPKVWNHGVGKQPSGMNRLYADGHVTWANANGGVWTPYARINTSLNLWWHWLD